LKKHTPLKDGYDGEFLARLAAALERAGCRMESANFVAAVCGRGWRDLELKGRIARMAEVIDDNLPRDFAAALEILDRVVPQFAGLEGLLFPAVVELRAVSDFETHWDAAVDALARYTRHSTSELAVRPMIIENPDRMLAAMMVYAQADDEHVRRLASEGCRPRLPWAMALPELKRDPAPILPILEILRDDSSEYVRRSVANNLNDISKDHPERVLTIAERWLGEEREDPNRVRLVKHACRTLLKSGEPRAMRLFGFTDPQHVTVSKLELDSSVVPIGGQCVFRVHLEGKPALGLVRLEYVIYYRMANGSLGPKVFKLSEFESPAVTRQVVRRHAFRDLSTRKHHAGGHELALRVNGVEKARVGFTLST